MNRQHRNRCICLLAWLFSLLAWPVCGQELNSELGEAVLMIPRAGFTEPSLEVTLYRPPGEGPFPILLINHGKAPGNAHFQARYRPEVAAREFVSRGFAVVVPMRQGFSKSGGSNPGTGCDGHNNGLQQARSVRRTLDWLAQQPWADLSRNVMLGQSHGGLTTLAYGTAPHPGTRLLVNFAGGLRQEGCHGWERGLIEAIGNYGASARLPSIWFYGDNDSFFPPFVWQGAFERYTKAGGQAELVAFGSFGTDSHNLFGSRAGLKIWLPKVIAAMAAAGLPTEVLHEMPTPADLPAPPASDFAALDAIDKLPLAGEAVRNAYSAWLAAEAPKAFAIFPGKRGWGSAWGGDRPIARALANCERRVKEPCKLYAVDDKVVWRID